jgi:hypothetical protein
LVLALSRIDMRSLLLFGFIVGALPALCEDQTFELKPDRRTAQVGVEMEGKYVTTRTTTESSDFGAGKQETNSMVRIELLTRWRVTSSSGGDETRELQIDRLVQTDGSRSEELLPKGTTVIAKQIAGEKFFTAANLQISNKARRALAGLVALDEDGAEGSCTDARMLNADSPKRIGESWPVNSACFIQIMKGSTMAGDPDRMQATVKLAGIEEHNGIRCFRLELTGELYWPDIPSPLRLSPQFRDSQLKGDTETKLQATELLPLDAKLREVQQEHVSETISKMAISRGVTTGTLEIRVRVEHKLEQKPLKN